MSPAEDDRDMIVALEQFRVDQKLIEEYLDDEVPKSRKLKDETDGKQPDDEELIEPPAATLGLQRLVQRAIFQVQSSGIEEVRPEDLFVAIFQAKDSIALHTLDKHGIQKLSVIEYISHGTDPSSKDEDDDKAEEDEEGGLPAERHDHKNTENRGGNDPLSQFTVALHELARDGKQTVSWSHAGTGSHIQTLCRRRKNNSILVGEAGVGNRAR